ncbi:MAG: mannose-1-phosphate guanylyltransferase [Planctomycetota bacterium]
MKNTYVVIMAGGSGTRFWPRGRRSLPKQLLAMGPGGTLIQETWARIPASIGVERTLVLTGASQVEALCEQLPELSCENVIAEPAGRDTAPCIALAAAVVHRRCADAVMIVLAADHVIQPPEAFQHCLERAVQAARSTEGLITLGIPPSYAATGYGYLELGAEIEPGLREVANFVEKPVEAVAQDYLAAGNYLWNSGIFIWKAATVLEELKVFVPQLAEGVERIAAADGDEFDAILASDYPKLEKISIDYAVMERSKRRYCVPATFEWDDVGSFSALARLNPADARGNVALGDVLVLDTKGCIIDNRSDGLVATLGVSDLIVVRTQDAVLVARKDQAERVKEIVQELERKGETRYL